MIWKYGASESDYAIDQGRTILDPRIEEAKVAS